MKSGFVVTLAIVLGAMFVLPEVIVAEKDEPEEVTLTGNVSVTKDEDGKIEKVQLIVAGGEDEDDIVYNIVLNKKGKKLGEKLAGKKAEVEGILAVIKNGEDEEENWVKVKEFKEVVEEKKDEGEGENI